MQAAVVKLAAHAGGKRFTQPAPEIATVDISEFVGERIVEISACSRTLQYTCFEVAYQVSNEHFSRAIGRLPGVQESCPLLGIAIGLRVEVVQVL